MNEEEVFLLLKDIGAIVINDHIVYRSGRHGAIYIDKDAAYPHTRIISLLCRHIAERVSTHAIDTVIGPALGGIILAQWIAHHLSELAGFQVHGVFAEKREGEAGFAITREYSRFIARRNVLVAEDILTTGGSVKAVVDAVRMHHGRVVGVSALWNRGRITPQELGNVPFIESLVNISLPTWSETDCPLCKNEVPINIKIGGGREFIEKKTRGAT